MSPGKTHALGYHDTTGSTARGLRWHIRARGMPWVLAAGYHVAFQGGLEGRRGLALLRVAVELANHSEQGEGQVVELQRHS